MDRSTRSPALDASASYVEQGWDALTDEQLLSVQWFTDAPLSLPNLQTVIPLDLGEFQIELAYELSADDAPVPCAHCPQHQKHRKGFVLRDGKGRRYLLGSTCGPNAYGSDYRLASSARTRMKRRYDALVGWRARCDGLTDLISALSDGSSSEAVKSLRRARGALERNAPRVVALLRSLRGSGVRDELHLTVFTSERDFEAENRVNEQFLAEVSAITDLNLSNKEFNRRRQQVVERLNWGRQIVTMQMRDFGTLQGAAWIRNQINPTTLLADTVSRLRGLYAIGRTTQDKKTSQIEKLSRQVDEELMAGENALRTISDAAAFFDPGHLSRVSAWLNGHRDAPGEAVVAGTTWEVTETGRATVATVFEGDRPEFEFLRLRA